LTLYITIEGPEATGKTTQANLLLDNLRHDFPKTPVILTKEPGSSFDPACKSIRKIILEADVSDKAALLLFLADRAQHIAKVIRPNLNNGNIVISDRSSLSTVVYHIAKLMVGTEENIPSDYFYEMLDFAQELQPDICFVANADFDWAKSQLVERGGLDRIEKFGDSFHRNVHALFANVRFDDSPKLHPLMEKIESMKCLPKRIVYLPKTNEQSIENISYQILDKVSEFLD